MQRWARNSILVAVIFVGAVAIWGTRSWPDHQQLKTPVRVEPAFVTYDCPAPFDHAGPGVRQGKASPYPLTREPCAAHHQRRVVAIFDLVAGGAGLAALVVFARRPGMPAEA